jgi:hypothetical protein
MPNNDNLRALNELEGEGYIIVWEVMNRVVMYVNTGASGFRRQLYVEVANEG